MKTLLSLFLSAVIAPAVLCAADFEGTVTLKLTSQTQRETPPAMTYSIKGPATRIDVTAPGKSGRVAMILDSTKTEMTILMLDRKMYMTRPMPKAGASAPVAGGAPTPPANSAIEKTTATEKILGYDCVKYTSKVGTRTAEIWVTDQLGSFAGLGGGNPMAGMGRGAGASAAGASQPWESALAGLAVFPLRVVASEDGKETFRMEATAIEKVSLPASTFVAPSDFQNLSAMMQGMGLPPGMKLPGGN